jgi:hypothetical protein
MSTGPTADQSPRGERPEPGEKVIVIDSVERRFQVRVQNPQPFGGLAAQRVEDRFSRVLAAASRPEPIGPGLEPGFPLGLERMKHQHAA